MNSNLTAWVAGTACAAVAFGCSTTSDTGSGGSGGSGGGASAEPVSLSMTIQEFGSSSPLVGATVTFDGASYTTDGAGRVTLLLPENTTSAIGLTQTGFPDHIVYATMLDVDRAATYDVGSDATLSALASALTLTRDPSKGLLSVGVLDGTPDASGPLAGAVIGIDAESEAQLVFDGSAQIGFSLGDTTLAGSSSASIFVNVDPGTVTPAITPPSGYVCDLGPSTVQVAANGYTIVNYYCHR